MGFTCFLIQDSKKNNTKYFENIISRLNFDQTFSQKKYAKNRRAI